MRNNRKKPKKFSDGESPVSPPAKEKDSPDEGGGGGAGGGGGRATEVKKSIASRELSRLGDDVVVGKELIWKE